MALFTTVRYRRLILLIIFCAIVVNYFDRQIVSVLKPTLKTEFRLDDRGYAVLINIFTVCYAVMYPVAGWLVDKFGPRRTMLAGMVVWSTACLGTAMTKTLGLFRFFNGMLGIAEPIAFPVQLRVIAVWFPGKSRATANSISASGSPLGAVLAPPLVAWLALAFNWRAAFFVPGALGLGLAVLWWIIYRDPPPEVAAEVAGDSGTAEAGFTWRQLWCRRSLWGILLCRFISDPVWYFCLFWLPGYLQENSGLTIAQVGMVGWIPFLVADLGGIGGAIWSDRLVKRGMAPLRARKIMLASASVLGPVCALIPHLPHPAATLVIFSIVGCVCRTWLFNLGVVIIESFPTANVGSVIGIAAGCGAVGAIIFNAFVGHMMVGFGPARVFGVMALLQPLAAFVLWMMVRREAPPSRKRETQLA
jgi:ACS family hexuronate transporter-like MFS transporter